jgi:asparagine synthetase B (glutamine-hydrolysing)
VLWDETNRILFAARDRFGIKPLFYAVHNQTLYFASEVKALFAAGVPALGMPNPSLSRSNTAAISFARYLTAFSRFHPATICWQQTSTSS